MATAYIELTDKVSDDLRAIAQRTGKQPNELIREAIEQLIQEFKQNDRWTMLRQARGIWKDRQDIPSLENLRAELDRSWP